MLPVYRKGPEIADKFRPRHPDLVVLYMSGYQQGIPTTVSFIRKPFMKNEFATKISLLGAALCRSADRLDTL
ncbi:MAG: hypothetical protein ACI9HY_002245 [Planctomycetaceae bacterium]|jgi:hypothetical protein